MQLELFGKQVYIRKEIVIAVSFALIMIICIAGYILKEKGGQVVIDRKTEPEDSGKTAAVHVKDIINGHNEDPLPAATEEIKIYILGCVKNAGVVTLKKGQIIDDAIKAAGGATKEADLENVNLAYILNENTMLKILSKKERQFIHNSLNNTLEHSGNKSPEEGMQGVRIIKDRGEAVAGDIADAENSVEQKGKININTATVSELDTLPGVGEKTANDIIAYREKNGRFKKIEDIMNVPRIGESRFSQMRELITVG
ncbi:MAG: helix-hairpin-helix domain-containing protein [Clostridia bacterium]|nr:helix-hairpin-helix domain-containing protein [Clostridia bacterium]